MGFPTRLLKEGESVALDMRPHWWFFAPQLFSGIPVVALLVFAASLDDDLRTIAYYVVGAVALIWAVWLGVRLLSWQTTHFVVTSDRLIHRSGVLAKHGLEIPLERVNDIAFHRSLWERVIGAGDLVIESAGERGQQLFTDIPHPDSVQQTISRAIEANSQKQW